jgi:hypothetical protein
MRQSGRNRAIGALLSVAFGAAPAAALADVHLAFDPAIGIIEGTGTLDVDVVVDAAATDLRGFSFVVGFDDTVVEVDSVFAGDLLAGAPCAHFLYWFEDASADSVAVDGAALGCSMTGPGSVVTIRFRALPRPGGDYPVFTALTWRSAVLRDSNNDSIPTILHPGYIIVNGPIAVAPATWGRLKAPYLEAPSDPVRR